jgi:DNA polymerase-3 subunit delta'
MLDFFPQMQQWVQKSEDLEQDLECIKLWVRDLILLSSLNDYRPVFNIDEATRNRIRNVRPEALFRLNEEIEQAMARFRQNANKQLTLEGVCLAIKDGLYGESRWHSLS